MQRLNVLAFGLACGVLDGGYMCLTALLSLASGGSYAKAFLRGFGSIHPGFGPTLPGALLGLAWGFADGFVVGFLLAALYNRLLARTKEE